jgi:hypothetical protein
LDERSPPEAQNLFASSRKYRYDCGFPSGSGFGAGFGFFGAGLDTPMLIST